MTEGRPTELGVHVVRAWMAQLAEAPSTEAVIRVLVGELRCVLGAASAILAVPTDDGRHLVLASEGLPEEVACALSTLEVGSALPIARVYREGTALFAETPAAVAASLPRGHARSRTAAFAAVPVRAGGRTIAAAGFGFETPHAFAAADRETLVALAYTLGDALERARLRDGERAARRRLEVLAEAEGRFLEATTDLEALLASVARFAGETTGDAAVVRIAREDGAPPLAAAFHADPAVRAALAAPSGGAPSEPAELDGGTLFLPVVDRDALRSQLGHSEATLLERASAHALIVVPLRSRSGRVGTLSVLRDRPHAPFTLQDRLLVEAIADRAGLALAYARLHAEHAAARARAEQAADRTARLQAVTAALANALGVEEVVEVATALAVDAAGGVAGGLGVSTREGGLRILGQRGVRSTESARPRERPAGTDGPMPVAFRSGTAQYYESSEEIATRHPRLGPVSAEEPRGALAVVPLRSPDAVSGVLEIRFAAARRFEAEERAFLENLGDQCGQALARAQLWERERDAARRQAVLADASRAFSEAGGDLAVVLDAVAEKVAHGLGASCLVCLASPDRRRLEVRAAAHPDPALREVLVASTREPIEEGPGGHWEVVRTGRVVRTGGLPADRLASLRPAQRALVERFPAEASLIVPLTVDGRVVATLSATRHVPAPAFEAEDELLLDEIAQRAALAIARAHQEAERRAERERLARVAREAQVASSAKDEFLAMLSHELRNPLSPIVTALQLMRLREGAAGCAREREVIERQVAHLVRLVDDLLDVSRITRGKIRLSRRPVDLGDVVARAIELASPLLEERRHALTVELAAGLRLNADEHRVAQVLANLLTNAARYTDGGGRISVRARAEDGMARIEVQDSGIGLSPALLPHIFELFVQGERHLDRAPGGLGIGLAIVRSLVDLHGGQVAAESAGAGRGSTFTVWLPLAPAVAGVASPPPPPRPTAAVVPAIKVLVVDDNRDAAELLAEALRARGHDAFVAHDGPSALAALATVTPRVALLDIGLPVMDGYELAGRLRAALAPTPIALVAVTGYGQDPDRQAAAEAGFAEHLGKPVELDRICAVVERLGARG
jgi:signal transduction histidine kinase